MSLAPSRRGRDHFGTAMPRPPESRVTVPATGRSPRSAAPTARMEHVMTDFEKAASRYRAAVAERFVATGTMFRLAQVDLEPTEDGDVAFYCWSDDLGADG